MLPAFGRAGVEARFSGKADTNPGLLTVSKDEPLPPRVERIQCNPPTFRWAGRPTQRREPPVSLTGGRAGKPLGAEGCRGALIKESNIGSRLGLTFTEARTGTNQNPHFTGVREPSQSSYTCSRLVSWLARKQSGFTLLWMVCIYLFYCISTSVEHPGLARPTKIRTGAVPRPQQRARALQPRPLPETTPSGRPSTGAMHFLPASPATGRSQVSSKLTRPTFVAAVLAAEPRGAVAADPAAPAGHHVRPGADAGPAGPAHGHGPGW